MSKIDKALFIFIILGIGWILGRFTEAVAVGHIKI
jgi:hypothetical protein